MRERGRVEEERRREREGGRGSELGLGLVFFSSKYYM